MFHIQDHRKFSDTLWAIFGNGWKCILNSVTWFVSIILNFNALCDAHSSKTK